MGSWPYLELAEQKDTVPLRLEPRQKLVQENQLARVLHEVFL